MAGGPLGDGRHRDCTGRSTGGGGPVRGVAPVREAVGGGRDRRRRVRHRRRAAWDGWPRYLGRPDGGGSLPGRGAGAVRPGGRRRACGAGSMRWPPRPPARDEPPSTGPASPRRAGLADRVARPAQHRRPTRRACATWPSCSPGRASRCRRWTWSRPPAVRRPRPPGPTSARSWTTTARRAYRQRLAELDGELAEAEADADLGRAGAAARSSGRCSPTSSPGALGLGGRPRIAGDPAERARKAVTMRIRAAITTIGRQDDALGPAPAGDASGPDGCAATSRTSPVSWQS